MTERCGDVFEYNGVSYSCILRAGHRIAQHMNNVASWLRAANGTIEEAAVTRADVDGGDREVGSTE